MITVSDSIAGLLRRRYDLPEQPVVVRNTVPYWEPTTEDRTLLRRNLGIPGSQSVLTYHGAITRARGLERVLDVLQFVPDATLVAIGAVNESDRQHFREYAASREVGRRFHLLGPVPYGELLPLLFSADAGIYLLDREPTSLSYKFSLPNKLFEMIMARLPVVVSDLPEIGGLVRTYGVGEAVDPTNVASAGEAISRVLTKSASGELRMRLDVAAVELSWEREEGRLLDLYSKLVPD